MINDVSLAIGRHRMEQLRAYTPESLMIRCGRWRMQVLELPDRAAIGVDMFHALRDGQDDGCIARIVLTYDAIYKSSAADFWTITLAELRHAERGLESRFES